MQHYLEYSLDNGRPYPNPCIGVLVLVVPPMSPPDNLTLVAEVYLYKTKL